MRHHVTQALKTLEKQGYDPEVIDLISLKPLDMETIGASIRKTHRVIIVEECMRTGGIAAELIASINERFLMSWMHQYCGFLPKISPHLTMVCWKD